MSNRLIKTYISRNSYSTLENVADKSNVAALSFRPPASQASVPADDQSLQCGSLYSTDSKYPSWRLIRVSVCMSVFDVNKRRTVTLHHSDDDRLRVVNFVNLPISYGSHFVAILTAR